MKQLFLSASLAVVALCIGTAGFSQDDKAPIKKSEEIIIKTDGDNDSKTIIEIDGDKITVNGQPLKEYKGTDVKVMRRKAMIANSDNFLKRPGMAFNLNKNENRTFLGVLTAKDDKGALIKKVTKASSAEKAGLKENDVITKFGDKRINTPEELAEVVRTYQPGDEVSITFLRDNKKETTKVILGKSGDFASAFSFNIDSLKKFDFDMPAFENLKGLNHRYYRFFNDDDRPRMGIEIQDTKDASGVKILNVEAGSAAEKAGLQKDDIIIEMNGGDVTNTREVSEEIADSNDNEAYKLKVKRDNKEIIIKVQMPQKLNKMKM